jgi:hypothetical protein
MAGTPSQSKFIMQGRPARERPADPFQMSDCTSAV